MRRRTYFYFAGLIIGAAITVVGLAAIGLGIS
jgi:hypothetical protein